MTIRTRLNLILVLCAVVVVTLSGLLLRSAGQMRTLAHAPQAQLANVRRADVVGDAVAAVAKELVDITRDGEAVTEAEESLVAAKAALAELLAGATDPRARALAIDVAKKFEELAQGGERVLRQVRAGDREAAAEAALELGEAVYEDSFRTALSALQHHEDEIAEQNEADANRAASSSIFVAVILVACGITTLVIAVFIVLGVQRRIAKLASSVTSLGTDARTRVTDTSGDELGQLGRTFNQMADDLDHLIETRAQKEALASELALAARLQQSLLPRAPVVLGLDIAGAMTTADEVGGDYYDVIPTRDGAWIAIGDVSGHGFNAGIVMLMAQAAVAAAVRANPTASPSHILRLVNAVLHDNIRERLGRSEHMTLTLLHYQDDGTVAFAGAHQEIIVRHPDGSSRTIETPGPWLAVVPDLDDLEDGRIALAPGEAMVLFTDGVVEARTDAEHVFGFEQLVDTVLATPSATARGVRDAVFARLRASAPALDDDATVLVIRRLDEEIHAAA